MEKVGGQERMPLPAGTLLKFTSFSYAARSGQVPVPLGVGHAGRFAELLRLRHPADPVGDDPLDLGLVVDGILLVARAEVEDPALAAGERDSRAEDFATFKRADEDEVVGLGNVEELAVHLLLRDHDRAFHAGGN